jgi:hypothetical protein
MNIEIDKIPPFELFETGRRLAFQPVSIQAPPGFAFETELFVRGKRQTELILSDLADFGCESYQNAQKNLALPLKNLTDLSLPGISVLIAGGGPSIQKLDQHRADLLLAGGKALQLLAAKGIVPDCIGGIDPHPGREIELFHPFWEAPLLFLPRFSPRAVSIHQAERLAAPESLRFPAYWRGPFDPGWTVVTFLIEAALSFGASSITLLGVDLSSPREKYKGVPMEGIETVDRKGRNVFTQPDWIETASWIRAKAAAHPEVTFIDAGGEGLDLGIPIGSLPPLSPPFPLEQPLSSLSPLAFKPTSRLDYIHLLYSQLSPLLPGDEAIHKKLLEERCPFLME